MRRGGRRDSYFVVHLLEAVHQFVYAKHTQKDPHPVQGNAIGA